MDFKTFDNVIFDVDGTIVDSALSVLACLEKVAKELQLSYEENALTRELIGPPLPMIFKALCPTESEEALKKAVALFRQVYDANPSKGSCVYDGMMTLISTLRYEGKKVFVATYKPLLPTKRLIEDFNLGDFEDVYTPDSGLNKAEMIAEIISKHHLEKEKTIMVGDALSDIEAAHTAGIQGVGVLWGYEKNRAALLKIADFIVEKL